MISVFHGSRHQIKSFSTEYINTGEKNQSFGWGLYFAGSESVAETYKTAGTTRDYSAPVLKITLRINGVGQQAVSNERVVLSVNSHGYLEYITNPFVHLIPEEDPRACFNNIVFKLWGRGFYKVEGRSIALTPPVLSQCYSPSLTPRPVTKYFMDNPTTIYVDEVEHIEPPDSGYLYRVDLNVNLGDLLFWDDPISSQSKKIQAAVKAITPRANLNATGESWYHGSLSEEMSDKDLSLKLLDNGVPGLMYFNGYSRDRGSSVTIKALNFVIFDDSYIVNYNPLVEKGEQGLLFASIPAGVSDFLSNPTHAADTATDLVKNPLTGVDLAVRAVAGLPGQVGNLFKSKKKRGSVYGSYN